MAAEKQLQIVLKLRDEATKALQKFDGQLSDLQKTGGLSGATLTKFAGAAAAAATAIGAFGLKAVHAAGDLEQTKIAFETMLGSAQNADRFIRELTAFARKTPFELKGLEEASKRLLAYGATQDEVLPEIKILGDIAAGVGTDKLPNLILAFGQMRAATRLTGMELRQFTEAGVPLLDALAKQFGVSVASVQDMVSAGEVGFPAVRQALEAMTQEGGKFADLMQKQSTTLGGMWSNLQDSWEIFLRNQGERLIEWAKSFTRVLIFMVENVLPPLVDSVAAVIDSFGKFFTGAHSLFSLLEEKYGVITTMKEAWDSLVSTFNEYLLPSLQELWVSLQPILPYLELLGKLIFTVVIVAIKQLAQIISSILVVAMRGLALVLDTVNKFIDIFGSAWNKSKEIMDKVISTVDRLISKIKELIELAKSAGGGIVDSVISFAGFRAAGGPVSKGKGYVVGENGPEYFTPSTSGRVVPNSALGGAGIILNLTISGGNYVGEGGLQEFGTKIGDIIMDNLRLNSRLAI